MLLITGLPHTHIDLRLVNVLFNPTPSRRGGFEISNDFTFDGRVSSCLALASLTCSHIFSSFASGSGTSGGVSGTIVDTVASDLLYSSGDNLGVLAGVVLGANAFSISASKELDGGGLEGFLAMTSIGMVGGTWVSRGESSKDRRLGSGDYHEEGRYR